MGSPMKFHKVYSWRDFRLFAFPNFAHLVLMRLTAVICAVFLLLSAILSAEEKPNFIVIFVDDLGYGDVGCFGNELIRTPVIDRMAREGMRFDNFYANCPVCSPTRRTSCSISSAQCLVSKSRMKMVLLCHSNKPRNRPGKW